MSEITVMPLFPTASPRRHLIDPVAFFAALIGGPLLVTALSFWLFLVPVAALAFGGPLYLIVGTPVLMWHLSRHPPNRSAITWLTFATLLCVVALGFALAVISGNQTALGMAVFYLVFGMIFAPLWGNAFAALYIRLRRPFYATPI